MRNRGLKLDKVTVGKGYNDVEEILEKRFKLLEVSNLLNGYRGYSDADNLYEITSNKQNVSNKR